MKKKSRPFKKTKFTGILTCSENIIEEFREVEIEYYGVITINNLGTKVYTKTGKVPSLFLDEFGYLSFNIGSSKTKIYKTLRIHRLVALAFLPNPENLPEVNHKNGDKMKNDITNLEWCTGEYNLQHAWNNGLIHGLKGETNGRAKLNKEQVLEIRGRVKNKEKRKDLAQEFGVSLSMIDKIVNKNNWKDI